MQAVETQRDLTMPELAARLLTEQSVRAAPATLSRLLGRRGFTYKKSPAGGGSVPAPTFGTSAASGRRNASPACASSSLGGVSG